MINNIMNHDINWVNRITFSNPNQYFKFPSIKLDSMKDVNDVYDYVFPSCSESEIVSLGRYNDRHGLIGISEKTAKHLTSKSVYYSIFKKLDIPCPSYKIVPNNETLFIHYQNKYPCIVKESNGSGSHGSKICNNATILKQFALTGQTKNVEYIVQDYIPGDVCSLAGTVVDKEIQIDLLVDNENDCFPYCAETGQRYPSKHINVQSKVVEYLYKFFDYIELNNTAFMLDFIVFEDQIFFIDFSARTPVPPLAILWYGNQQNYIANVIERIVNKTPFNVDIDKVVMWRQKKNIPINKNYYTVCKNGVDFCVGNSIEDVEQQYKEI